MASRILIVEDEPIVALNYASILEDAGCDVAGPVSTINKGIEIIERERIGGAVLDIDLGGVTVDPIVTALQRKGIPYIFVSAFPDRIGPYKDAVFLEKPCTAAELIKAVNALVLPGRSEFDDFGCGGSAHARTQRQVIADACAMLTQSELPLTEPGCGCV